MAKKTKRVLTESEEFHIMKSVLDKFLWIGTILLTLGLFWIVTADLIEGLWLLASGGAVLLVFAIIIAREFELLR